MCKKEELFNEFDRQLMESSRPSIYFNELYAKSNLFIEDYPFTMLGDLKKIEQSPKYHPEGNVWNHTMQVVDAGAFHRHKSRDPRVFMWSALLHDLGKAPTTKRRKGRITAYDHDRVGAKMAEDFLKELTDDRKFIDKIKKMVRWHMQILYVVKDLPFANIESMLEEVSPHEIGLLGLCDRLGRQPMSDERIAEEYGYVKIFMEKCQEYGRKKEGRV